MISKSGRLLRLLVVFFFSIPYVDIFKAGGSTGTGTRSGPVQATDRGSYTKSRLDNMWLGQDRLNQISWI